MPVRIQRERTKGWRMPENTVYVGRPTKWGNPFRVDEWGRDWAVKMFRIALLLEGPISPMQAAAFMSVWDIRLTLESFGTLRGKDLACWCPLDWPCHADALLEIANVDLARERAKEQG